MIAFYNGKFLEKEQIAISPDDRGFLFADGVYEVIRTYRGEIFELRAHLARLEYGLTQLRIGGVDIRGIGRVAQKLIEKNRLLHDDAMVYIQVTRGSAPRAHQFPPAGSPPNVYAFSSPLQPHPELQSVGTKAILLSDQRWSRCDIKTTALVANTLACQRAKESGAFEALFVRDGAILEGSRTNVMFVKERTLITAPLNNYILPGITRQVVLKQARALSIPVLERPAFETELSEINEVFLVGTTIEVAPVVQVADYKIGTGEPGPITKRLLKFFEKRKN